MTTESEDEFYEDFGASGLGDRELEEFLEEARQSGNVRLRQLIKQHQALRYVSNALLGRIEESESGEELNEDQFIRLARFIIRGEGGIGSTK